MIDFLLFDIAVNYLMLKNIKEGTE